ncbi:tetratricopeptide repeat protein [Candidatus Marinimicrobia bacterium]|nr:tetratricopeptide repeat protein [Candidatus Neomarinimicrobiota bacterium]
MKINQIIIIICFLSFSFSQDKGIEFYQNQEYEKAKDFYDNILIKKGENEEAHFGHGASSYQQGDLELAKKSFQESLKSTDNDLRSKAFYNLGNTFYKNKKNEEAISFYRKALELNPRDKEARFNYEYLKYQKKPPEEDNKEEQKEEEQKEQEQEEQEQEEQEQKEQEQKEQEQKEQEQKEQDLKQAESILNALKQDEKIMQKKQISRSKSRKLAKDW